MSCYIFSNGANKIIPVDSLKIAYRLKRENPEFLLVGERDWKKPKGFDFGNSPSEIESLDFNGKIVIQTTSAGTKGLHEAKKADEIITGSFVNAEAIVKYIKNENPKKVSLVAMGVFGDISAPEDLLFAHYIKNELTYKPNNFEKIKNDLRSAPGLQRYFEPEKHWVPERDFELCLNLNKFSFILKVEPFEENLLYLEKVNI
jgi:2-phosphosulfolactate phosphatase